jgi:hypothetical protein
VENARKVKTYLVFRGSLGFYIVFVIGLLRILGPSLTQLMRTFGGRHRWDFVVGYGHEFLWEGMSGEMSKENGDHEVPMRTLGGFLTTSAFVFFLSGGFLYKNGIKLNKKVDKRQLKETHDESWTESSSLDSSSESNILRLRRAESIAGAASNSVWEGGLTSGRSHPSLKTVFFYDGKVRKVDDDDGNITL